ncbi:MAG: hypothetical protein R3229_18250, partial [Alphaproteobacteria bacterium]|nr:hypothetical protein [Alphaproteobacteria bacterium]
MTRPGDPAPAREAWLLSLIRPDLRPYAERAPLALPSVTALLERIGNPHRGLRCIHIAGSKGKGSVALMTEAILQHAGLRTGTFTSPHLERWSERIRIDGHEVSGDRFDEALGVLKPEVAWLTAANPDNPPSFFDTLTAAALWLFKKHDVDLAIVETGI